MNDYMVTSVGVGAWQLEHFPLTELAFSALALAFWLLQIMGLFCGLTAG